MPAELTLTNEMLMTLAVLGIAIFLFVSEWVRVDVVGIIMMLLPAILGLISPKQAFVGLSSNAVVSIIAVIILGYALDKTGAVNKIANPIIKLGGNSERKIMCMVAGAVAMISSVMQNIGAVALFMPATMRISKRLGVPASRLMMPLAFLGIIGGTLTLIGNSPTILLNDVMVLGGKKLEPFGLFTQTPIGIGLVASALLYFAFFGRYILPAKTGEADKGPTAVLQERYKDAERTFELHVPEGFGSPRTLGEMAIRPNYLLTVVAINQKAKKDKIFVPRTSDIISPGDDIVVVGNRENVQRLAADLGFIIKPGLEEFAESFARTNAGMVEAVVAPQSELIGRSMSQVRFKEKFSLNPLAVFRGDRIFYGGITNLRLQMGDALLLQGPWDRFHILNEKREPRELIFASPLEGEILRPEKAKLAALCMVGGLSLAMITDLPLGICLMLGALGTIIFRVISVDEAYRAVDWMTVFLLAGLIPLGLAFEQTGTAAYIAYKVMELLGTVPYIVLLLAIGILTSFFTLVVSNVGATVLLVPLCMNMAVMAGGDPRLAALVVALSASNTFVLPTHQCNALVMKPGGYRTLDYVKAGAIMTALYMTVLIAILYLLYV
ncbi:MAG: SLC13 family permease [Desulfovibrionales bacterium]|nr:SLC13 family permease [Desulfovibrionales bacterium]